MGRKEKIMKKVIYDPREQKKIGMLTPSSNTTLEPICSNMVAGKETIRYDASLFKTENTYGTASICSK